MATPASAFPIVILAGSVRPGNFTLQALRLVEAELHALGVPVTVVDPAHVALPLPGREGADASTEAMRAAVRAAAGLIVVSPEYHGSPSSVIKLVIENLGFPSLLAGKPMALIGVAAGAIGAIKSLEMLRSLLSHVGALVLPGPVSVAGVQQVFKDGRCQDPAVEERLRGVPRALLEYLQRTSR